MRIVKGAMTSYDVIQWGKPLRKAERATPKPGGTEVLLKIKYCGVCHSDVHIRDGYFEMGGGKRFRMSERGMSLPATLGHEPYGTVIAAGPEARDVPIGGEFLAYPWIGCGACKRCGEGMDNLCMAPRYVGLHRPGGYADHLLVPHPRYLIDAAGIDPAWAAILSCSGLASYSAVAKLHPIPPHEWVLVIGAGGLGLTAIGMLKGGGHERVLALDTDDAKLKAAAVAGAGATFSARDSDLSRQIEKTAGGPIYAAIDMVGSTETATLALKALRKGGRLILVGLYGGEVPLSLVGTIQRALLIQGSHLGSVAELKSVVALARAGKLKPIPIQKRPLAEVNRTLDELKAGTIVGRVVVET